MRVAGVTIVDQVVRLKFDATAAVQPCRRQATKARVVMLFSRRDLPTPLRPIITCTFDRRIRFRNHGERRAGPVDGDQRGPMGYM